MMFNVHIQMIMFSSKISKNSKNKILHCSSILFYPVAKSGENSARWFSDALWQGFFLWCTILRAPGFEEKVARWFADAPWQRFFLWCTILRAPGFEEKAARWFSGAPWQRLFLRCTMLQVPGSVEKSERWFSGAPWQRFFCGVLFCGARVWRKGSTLVFRCTLAALFLRYTILREPGFEEKAARWLSGAPRPSLPETYRTGQLRSARRPLPPPAKEWY